MYDDVVRLWYLSPLNSIAMHFPWEYLVLIIIFNLMKSIPYCRLQMELKDFNF